MASKQLNSNETTRKNIIGNALDDLTESHLKTKLIEAVYYYFNNNLQRDWQGIPVKKDGVSPQNLHYSRLPLSINDPKKGKGTPIPVYTPDEFCRLYLMDEMKESEFNLATINRLVQFVETRYFLQMDLHKWAQSI